MGGWGCYSGAGGGRGEESVNPWDIGFPDLASGGREDGLATTDRPGGREQGRGRERWSDGGAEGKKGVRRISMAARRHVWISVPSLQTLTLQRRIELEEGRKSAC